MFQFYNTEVETSEPVSTNLGPTASNYPTCTSPIFNYIEKLRLDDSLNDDLEDINNLIGES